MTSIEFETLRDDLEALSVPTGHTRHLRWLANVLAVGRAASGDFEIFIRGPEMHSASSLVRRHVQHGEWRPEEGGASFSASRIILPAASYFASIASLIGIELLRAGIAGPRGTQAAFTDVEPIIEMAIRRGALSEGEIIGLIGELAALRQLILVSRGRPESTMRVIDSWQGWQASGGRDFRIGDHSIEVKTTQSITSIHEFSGLHQLEAQRLPSGEVEVLHLLSVGLTSSTTMGESLSSIVDSIEALLNDGSASPGLAQEFLRRVSLYGRSDGGYAHETMKAWSVYATRYVHTFMPRLYRIDDPAMLLLTRNMLSETFVEAEGLSFTMHIPERVSAFNPAPSWEAELDAMQRSVA